MDDFVEESPGDFHGQDVGNNEPRRPLVAQLPLQHREHPRAVSLDICNDIPSANDLCPGKTLRDHIQPHEMIGMCMGDHYRSKGLPGFHDPVGDVIGIAVEHKHVKEDSFRRAADQVRV